MIAHAIALILAAAAQPALAQQADSATDGSAGELEEIVVTGFRASLEESLSIKRDSAVAIDAIMAEDVADFPDLNLAESLQRIPGVSIARDAGEGRQITVRGLGPQFTRVRINGMEAQSTVGGTDAQGGTNRTRGFDFNVFASELFSELAVRKTAAAEVEEGSLGATVDLRASRPFDYSGATFVVGAQGGYNDLSEEVDPRTTLLMSNIFADGKVGALLSVAYTERNLSDDGASTVRWQRGINPGTTSTANAFGPNSLIYAPGYVGPTLAEINSAFHPRIPRYDHYENQQERLGVTGSLQFAPSDASQISLDVLYSKLDSKRYEMFLEAPVFSSAGGNAINAVDIREAEIRTDKLGNAALVYGVFDDVDVRTEQRYDEWTTEFRQFTLEGTHDFGDGFKVRGLLGTSKSEHDNPIQTTLLFDKADLDGYVYDYRGGKNRLPYINYGSTDVTAASTWTLSQIRLRPQTADNSYDTGEVNVSYDFTDRMAIKGGLQVKQYEFETTDTRRSNGTTTNQEGQVAAWLGVPIADYSTLTRLAGVGAPAGTTLRWLVPDVRRAGSLLNLYDESVFPMGIEPALGNNMAVKEGDTGFYLQFDFGFDVGSVPVRGNVGARYVQTDLESTGYSFVGGQVVKSTADVDYDNTLPSLNLVAELTDELLVRASAARVMTRPPLNNLAPSTTISVSGNARAVSAGNPALQPYEADAYDLSFEWYFDQEALLSLALFYKEIGSFVSTATDTRPYTGNPYGLPDELAIAACGNIQGCSPEAEWTFTVPLNTPGGDLKGLEVSYQQPFSFLPGFFSNFGVLLNYTFVESEVDYLNANGSLAMRADLIGLSQNAWNATLYYEDDRFSTRVSGAYRDEYLTTVPNSSDASGVIGTADTFSLDFSATYNFNDNLQFTFEALNLTDEFQDQWVGWTESDMDLPSFYHHTGRQYYLGARFKY